MTGFQLFLVLDPHLSYMEAKELPNFLEKRERKLRETRKEEKNKEIENKKKKKVQRIRKKKKCSFPLRESNPGRLGENQES